MKKTIYILLLIGLLTSCNKKDTEIIDAYLYGLYPTITSIDITVLSVNKFIVKCKINNAKTDFNEVIQAGAIIAEDEGEIIKHLRDSVNFSPSIRISEIKEISSESYSDSSKVYEFSLTAEWANPTLDHKYYFRPFLIIDDIEIWGNVLYQESPKVGYYASAPNVSNLSKNSVRLESYLNIFNADASMLPIKKGILINKYSNGPVTLNNYLDKKESSSTVATAFSADFSNLQTNTKYSAIAFAIDNNNSDTVYSSEVQFTPNADPSNYNDFTTADFTPFFIDNFSSNTHNWWTGTQSSYSVNISGGNYNFQASGSRLTFWPDWPNYTYPIDINKNYQIDLRMKVNSCSGDVGFVWGLNTNSGSCYKYLLNSSNKVRIENNKGVSNHYQDWTSTGGNLYSYQTYSVRVYDGSAYYFVNGNLFYTSTNVKQNSSENMFGFVNKNANAAIDYFNINYIL